MKNISPKKLKKLGGKVPFSSITKPSKPIRKKPRKKSETLRIYGPPARRAFVKSLPCAACGVVGYSENAHLLGNGGMSRKADADTIGPLCGAHPSKNSSWPQVMGCHAFYDEHRWRFGVVFPAFDPEKVAAETHASWLAIARQTPN